MPSTADPGAGRGPARRHRSDGRRNRTRLRAAAAVAFGELGAGAPLDLVARGAGVGNATRYRHFPTRGDPIAAVSAGDVSAPCAHGEALLAEMNPGDAVFVWLRAFVVHVAAKRDPALAIGDDPQAHPRTPFAERRRAMHAAAALPTRARQAGELRAEVDPADLLALANAIALTAAAPSAADPGPGGRSAARPPARACRADGEGGPVRAAGSASRVAGSTDRRGEPPRAFAARWA